MTSTHFKIPKEKLNKIRHIVIDEETTQTEWINDAIDKKLENYGDE